MIVDLTPYTVDAGTGILRPDVDTLNIYPISTRHMAVAFQSIRLRDADADAAAAASMAMDDTVVEDLDLTKTYTPYNPTLRLADGRVEDYYAALKGIQLKHAAKCDTISDVCVEIRCDPTQVPNTDPTFVLFPLVLALFVVCAELETDGAVGSMPGITMRIDASHERDLQTLTTICMTGSGHTNLGQLSRLAKLYQGQGTFD